MKNQVMVVVALVVVLGVACGSPASNRDAAVEASSPGTGGTVSSTDMGSGGATVLGAGGATVSGTGGVTTAGTGGIGAGGVSWAGGSAGQGGSGGVGTKPDGALPPADSGTDAGADTDVAITSCEKMAGACIPTIGGCAICPPGSEPTGPREGCASDAWCCIPATTHTSNQCTQGGGMCLMIGTCPDGWQSLRSTCDSGGGCCRADSVACRNARMSLDGGPTPDAVVLPPPSDTEIADAVLGPSALADGNLPIEVARIVRSGTSFGAVTVVAYSDASAIRTKEVATTVMGSGDADAGPSIEVLPPGSPEVVKLLGDLASVDNVAVLGGWDSMCPGQSISFSTRTYLTVGGMTSRNLECDEGATASDPVLTADCVALAS